MTVLMVTSLYAVALSAIGILVFAGKEGITHPRVVWRKRTKYQHPARYVVPQAYCFLLLGGIGVGIWLAIFSVRSIR